MDLSMPAGIAMPEIEAVKSIFETGKIRLPVLLHACAEDKAMSIKMQGEQSLQRMQKQGILNGQEEIFLTVQDRHEHSCNG